MNRKLIRPAVVVSAGLALLGGGAGAIASALDNGGATRQAILDDAAGKLGVTSSALDSALKSASIDQVNAALKAGTITQQQADALKARIEAGNGPLLGGFGFGGFGGMHGGMGNAAQLDAAATYLGETTDQLRTDLQAGKSLAQIAGDKGKSVDGLEQAMLDAAKTNLDKAVAAGKLTSAQEQQALDRLKAQIAAMVQRTGVGKGFGGRGSLSRGFGGGPGVGPAFGGHWGAGGPGFSFKGKTTNRAFGGQVPGGSAPPAPAA